MDSIIDAEWKRLGTSGTWWTSTERVAIANVARETHAGRKSTAGSLTAVAAEVTGKIATAAHTIDQQYVRDCHDRGLAPLPMVELLAVAAKVTAIDTWRRGIGEAPLPLPEPSGGKPSGSTVRGAKLDHGWLPTVGRASAPVCFSAVAAEHESLHQLHGALYLSMDEMRDNNIVKDLHRTQLELLAARTSYKNDCFY